MAATKINLDEEHRERLELLSMRTGGNMTKAAHAAIDHMFSNEQDAILSIVKAKLKKASLPSPPANYQQEYCEG